MFLESTNSVELCLRILSLAELKQCRNEQRLYIGDDFCERLIPEFSMVNEIISYAVRHNKKITLLTPYCTDRGLEKLRAILDIFDSSDLKIEVVINDMGVLRILNRDYKNFTPLFGRLNIGKLLYPYNNPAEIITKVDSKSKSNRLKQSITDAYFAFFHENNISRAEFDNIISVYLFSEYFQENDICATLYYPYTFIATTRRCIFPTRQAISTKFALLSCDRECLDNKVFLQNKHSHKIFVKGNSLLVHQEDTLNISNILMKIQEKKLVDRIVKFIV